MSGKRFSKSELFYLRNHIPITEVIKKLDIPFKLSEGYTRFLCPVCKEFNTAVNPETNLARCFLCKINYNPIDLVIKVKGLTFIESVNYLTALSTTCTPSVYSRPKSQKRPSSKAPCSIKEIINSKDFPLKLSPETMPHLPTSSHQELVLKVNRLEQMLNQLISKIKHIEKEISKM